MIKMKYVVLDKQGVSQVIGFILTFTIISIVTISVIYTASTIVNNRNNLAASLEAEDISNYIANAIVECTATRQLFPHANYSKTLEVPAKLGGRSYYVEVSNQSIYVNTTDDIISEKSTVFNQEQIGVYLEGKALMGRGEIIISSDNVVNEDDVIQYHIIIE